MSIFALVIEDDPDLATIFGEALLAAGFGVETIQDGSQALARLAEVTPDVIVLDLHLPSASGSDILDSIRSNERLSSTLVILATADARLADMMEGRADLVLVKPVSFAQLRDLARRLKSRLPSQPH